jgi:class 3 adenylate cyclase
MIDEHTTPTRNEPEDEQSAVHHTDATALRRMPHDGTYHFIWEFDLRATPQQMWPYISDTNRLNADVGQPAVQAGLREPANANDRQQILRFAVLGVPVEWEELPFEWVYPQRYGVLRRYARGPMKSMRVLIELEPRRAGGTHMRYHVWVDPNGIQGRIAVLVYIGIMIARRVAEVVQRYDELAVQQQTAAIRPQAVQFAPGGHQRMERLLAQLGSDGVATDLLERLQTTLEYTDDFAAAELRPYALADAWGRARRPVLEMFLRAARLGLLNFQWELLCPLCRNSNDTSSTLSEVNEQVHCQSCQIDYTVNFDRSVELTFYPNPAIRPVQHYEYCVGGPHRTPHIVAQQIVAPGQQTTIQPTLEPGRHRVRTLAYPGGHLLNIGAEGAAEWRFVPDPAAAADSEVQLMPSPRLHFVNDTDSEQIFMLERTAWSDQAVTAAEVTALHLFRSLFSNEALRPGEKISVGGITVVFTDLRGSTRLYREIGDAPAFGRVMSHFDVLIEEVANEGGALVKTIGDAVMAVFQRPLGAVRAMLRAQQRLANPPAGGQALLLKAGIHTGACIAVTLNERLDYFGSTVNIAARLEGVSSGQNIILTDAVHADPEVEAWLDGQQGKLEAECFTQALKGFDTETFELWRVGWRQLAARDGERLR